MVAATAIVAQPAPSTFSFLGWCSLFKHGMRNATPDLPAESVLTCMCLQERAEGMGFFRKLLRPGSEPNSSAGSEATTTPGSLASNGGGHTPPGALSLALLRNSFGRKSIRSVSSSSVNDANGTGKPTAHTSLHSQHDATKKASSKLLQLLTSQPRCITFHEFAQCCRQGLKHPHTFPAGACASACNLPSACQDAASVCCVNAVDLQ